jgi:NodT family efflux transporter outer membrane factor (OMF) lipoprotein
MFVARAGVLCCALLSACAVGPNYQRPATTPPAQWQVLNSAPESPQPRVPAIPVTDDAEALAAWWTWFEDPLLSALVAEAFAQNLDTRAAWARLNAARAERKAARAGGGPTLGAQMGASRQQNPLPGLAEGLTFSLYEMGFDAQWELDLFGRQRRRVEAADALVAAALEDQRGILTILCADVARAYTEMQSAQRQVTLAEHAVQLAEDIAHLSGRVVAAGLESRETVLVMEAKVAAFAARLPSLRIELASAQRQLELLLGLPPAQLAARLGAREARLPHTTLRVLLSPAAVLRQRPDIQQAERQLAAATALKAAAIADLYPRVSLAMFFGLRNTALGVLLSAASKSWSGGGSLTAPLFDSGRLRAAVDMSDARIAVALVNFEKSMLVALHETELALTRLLERDRQREAWALAVADLREAARLTSLRRAQGVVSQMDVLRARQAANDAEIALRRAEAAVTTETIAVMKALGAGVPPTANAQASAVQLP